MSDCLCVGLHRTSQLGCCGFSTFIGADVKKLSACIWLEATHLPPEQNTVAPTLAWLPEEAVLAPELHATVE